MTRVSDIAHGDPRRRLAFLAAVLLTALTASASFALALPERASALRCSKGHFCIWEHPDFEGGRYSSPGSDRFLSDKFFFDTRRKVFNRASSIFNAATRGSALDDVVVYMKVADDDIDPRYAHRFCLRAGSGIENLADWNEGVSNPWNDRVAGYRWVTDRECARAGRP